MTDQERTPVDISRIDRVATILAKVSIGEFDHEPIPISVENPQNSKVDPFARVEFGINQVAADLGEIIRANDLFVQKLQENAREMEEKLRTIERQQLAIQDLSTPIIEIWDDILTLPVIGVVDTRRSLDMTERLLFQIVEKRAQCVIIDITGVEVVDTMTADHFVKMIKAAGMLGAYCVVSGISPEVAQTLARIGVELPGVRTVRSLKEALKDCFLHLQAEDGH